MADQFTDVTTNFVSHPDTNQLVVVRGDRSIATAIRNLTLTERYERPFQPSIGTTIRSMLFDLPSPQTTNTLRELIKQLIVTHEPRVKLLDVEVVYSEQRDGYSVSLIYQTASSPEPITQQLLISRIR